MNQDELIINTSRKVVRNTGALAIGNIISKLCILTLFVISARYLGVAGFGKYTFALSFVGLFMVLGDLGLNVLAIREVTRDRSLIREYLGSIIILKTILSVLAVGIIFLVINLLDYPSETTRVVYIMGISLFFLYLSTALRWCFQAFQKMEYESLLTATEGILLLGIGFLALYLGKGLIGIAYTYLLAYIITFLFSLLITVKKFAKPKFKVEFAFLKYLIKTTLPIGLMSIFITAYPNINTVLISLIKDDTSIGWYNAGYRLVNSLGFLLGLFLIALFPVMSEFYKTSLEFLKKIIRKSIHFIVIIALPLAVGTTILSNKIIPIFWGEEFRPAIAVLQILIWSTVLIFINRVALYCLIAIDKQKISTFIIGLGLVINIILNLILIIKFSYIGAAIGLVGTEVIITLLAFYFIFKYLKVNPFSFAIFKIIIASLLMGTFTWWIRDFNIIFVVLVSAIFYFYILLLIKCVSKEDMMLLKQIFFQKNKVFE